MGGWPISFSPNAKPGVKRKQENVATKADKRKYEDKRDRCFQEHWLEKIPWLLHDERGMRCTICCNFYDNSKQQQGSSAKNLFLAETEVTVVDENEVEGSDKENEQKEQTEPVNVVEQTDEEDSESERESEMSSSECEMSEEETFRSINRIIEYEIEYVTV
jgi:hypothetical protein